MTVTGLHVVPEVDDGDNEYIAGRVWGAPGNGPEIIIRESEVRGGQPDARQGTWNKVNMSLS
jgi:hypothetical protein